MLYSGARGRGRTMNANELQPHAILAFTTIVRNVSLLRDNVAVGAFGWRPVNTFGLVSKVN